MSEKFQIVSPLDVTQANLWLVIAITMNGGSMTFPREVFDAMESVEVNFDTDENNDVVLSLEPYYEH
jgi:hypothetical protein